MPPHAIPTHELCFDGQLFQRGFWLYVWEVTPPKGKPMHYVGRTGDSSSVNAQSPFARMGQHLGFAENSAMIRNHLTKRNVQPNTCKFRLIAHGPVLAEAEGNDRAIHLDRRDKIAAMEMALCDELWQAGYDVLNRVSSRKVLDAKIYATVRKAFEKPFPKIRKSAAALAASAKGGGR